MDDWYELAIRFLALGYCFVVGAAVGSFVNVVVHRLPRGESLIRPASRCPKCGCSIRARDNLPILGWMLLHGRCRDCGEPISARYPIVEALVAGVAVLVAYFGYFTNAVGALPDPAPDGWRRLPLDGEHLWLAAAVAYRFFLIATLCCIALIEMDDFPTPKSLFLVALSIGFVLPLAWPVLRYGDFAGDWQTICWTLALGATVGLGLGWAAGRWVGRLTGNAYSREAVLFSFVLIGVYLGPTRVGATFLSFSMLVLVGLALRRHRLPFAPFVVAACIGVSFFEWTVGGFALAR